MSCAQSDHDGVVVNVDLGENIERGPGVWRNNTKIYEDKTFQQEFLRKWNTLWPTLHGTLFETWDKWWFAIKEKVKNLSIKHAATAKKRHTTLQATLYQNLDSLRAQLDAGAPVLQKYRTAKAEANKILKDQQQTLFLRSKAETYDKGNSNRMLKHLKERHQKSHIDYLKDTNGALHKEPREKLKIAQSFYQTLYKSEPTQLSDQNCFLKAIPVTAQSELLAGIGRPITKHEIRNAIKTAASNRSPGPDGIGIEFYKTFLPVIEDLLVEVFNCFFNNPPEDLTRGIVHLIHKKGPREDISNYRPITLLNCDYKIINKILASRIKLTMESLIHHHQFASPTKKIAELNLILREIHANLKHWGEGALVSVDFTKAYDTLNHDFLFEVLNRMNFAGKLQTYIKKIYSNPKSKILVNGHLSQEISLQRGVRQGDPLSTLLFILATDPLLRMINQEALFPGVSLQGYRDIFKTPTYADDLTLVSPSVTAIPQYLEILTRFGQASGLKINQSKTSALFYGSSSICPSIRKSRCLTILGNTYAIDTPPPAQTWREQMNDTATLVSSLENKVTFIEDRISLLRTHVLPTFLYKACTNPIPETIQAQITRLSLKLIFSMKEKVKYERIVQTKRNGGLNALHVPVFLDLQFIKPLLHYCKTRDVSDLPHPDFKYRICHQLGQQLNPFSNNTPDNTTPHASFPLDHWNTAISIFKKYGITKEEATQKTVKDIYSRIIEHLNPASQTSSPTLWENIWTKALIPQESLFNWKIANKILPTKNKPRIRRVTHSNKCPWCTTTIEGEEHLFTSCPIPKTFIELSLQIWSHITQRPAPSLSFATIGTHSWTFVPPLPETHEYLLITALNITKSAIWKERCKIAIESLQPDPLRLLSTIQQMFLTRIQIEQHRIRRTNLPNLTLMSDIYRTVEINAANGMGIT